MNDILERACKTFLQAFLGVFIPAAVTYLNNGWPESWDTAWVALAPALSAAIAAGISAAWNYSKQLLDD